VAGCSLRKPDRCFKAVEGGKPGANNPRSTGTGAGLARVPCSRKGWVGVAAPSFPRARFLIAVGRNLIEASRVGVHLPPLLPREG